MFSEGAEARMYNANVLGEHVLVKAREPKAYRVEALDIRLRVQRTRNEARMMQRALSIGVRVPRLIGLGRFSIYMEKLDGKLLKDAKIGKEHAKELGAILAELHNGNIIHGDFTTANVMLTKKGLYVIDFGLSESSFKLEEKAIDVLLMKRSLPKGLYSSFSAAYSAKASEGKAVMKRLAEIEKRGRYQVRTLA